MSETGTDPLHIWYALSEWIDATEQHFQSLLERERWLATMPYAEYLLTPEWQEKRLAALKRAGYRCQLCNADAELHVHHRTYERRGHEWDSDLIVLCAPCHRRHHGIAEPEEDRP